MSKKSTKKSKKSIKKLAGVASARNLGTNYPLCWNTGAQTHMTLIYFENVKRGYEQERVKSLAEDFLTAENVPTQLILKSPNVKWTYFSDRCVAVHSLEIQQIQKDLWSYFTKLGFKLRALRDLHIDLRGQSDQIINLTVGTRDWLH